MDKKLVREAFVEVAGKQAEPLVDFLDVKKYMNEFLIAKKLDLPINQTRNILYKINEHGLVSSTRKKDKKKGWYTYSWKIEELKCLEFLKGLILKKMDQLKNQIKNRESKEFYVCERCHVEFNEENALIHDFTCPECGNLLERKDNTKLIKEFKKNLENYEVILKTVDDEIGREQTLEAKKIKVKDAAVKRAKAKERAVAREKAKKEREKEGKGKEKKKPAKSKETKKTKAPKKSK
jgi:transcription initiation factor TFIIE subunit alpha